MHEKTSRFVTAYNRIEKRMRTIVRSKEHISFVGLVEKAAAKNSAVRQYRNKLKFLAELRNLLVHEHDHEKEVAVPSETTVASFEQLAEILTSPPLLLSVANKNVKSCGPSDPIGKAAQVMYDKSFSQLPVYDGPRLIGLVTGETIARWLAVSLASGLGMLNEDTVCKVLEYQETATNYVLLPETASVFEGLDVFDESLHSGKAKQAIILTAKGKPTESPLGIITPTNIPGILRAIQAEH